MERITIFAMLCILLIHTQACIWIFIHKEMWEAAKDDELEAAEYQSWVTSAGFMDYERFDLYWAAIYFSITTITTVGYGDVSAKNTYERMLGSAAMILGVISFSYATSALSSLIQDDDLKKAPYTAKIESLRNLNEELNLDGQLLREISAFIRRKTDKDLQAKEDLIEELPDRLKKRISIYMFNNYKQQVEFFQCPQESEEFIRWITPKLE